MRVRPEMAQGMVINNQWPWEEGTRVKDFTVQLQQKKESR